jgi:hypothetical protein
MLRSGAALLAVSIALLIVSGLWLTESIYDRDWRRDIVPGDCVRAEIGGYERGLIPFYRQRHYSQVPFLECERVAQAESPGSMVLSGSVLNTAISLLVIATAALGVRRLLGGSTPSREGAV